MAQAAPVIETPVRLGDEAGELETVRQLLTELGIGWRDDPADAAGTGFDLLISTPRHALGRGKIAPKKRARTHIVVADRMSRMLRKQLERHPCDFVVESALHPSALRLLIEHSLYRGPERRRGLRALMACEVKIKAGLFSKKATLMQLSERGAGLMVDRPIAAEQLTLRLPPSLTKAGKLDLDASIVKQQSSTGNGKGHLVSVVFQGVTPAMHRQLGAIMKAQAGGDALLRPVAAGSAGAQPAPAPGEASRAAPPKPVSTCSARAQPASIPDDSPAAEPAPGAMAKNRERREAARKPFRRRMLATLRGRAHAVVSKDISAGGMRLEPDAGLQLGDDLKVALYGARGTPPMVLRAKVVNNQGTLGMGLRFIDVGEKVRRRLDDILDQSAILGRADVAGGERPRMVFTEILDRTSAD